jgi:hypothetical protein
MPELSAKNVKAIVYSNYPDPVSLVNLTELFNIKKDQGKYNLLVKIIKKLVNAGILKEMSDLVNAPDNFYLTGLVNMQYTLKDFLPVTKESILDVLLTFYPDRSVTQEEIWKFFGLRWSYEDGIEYTSSNPLHKNENDLSRLINNYLNQLIYENVISTTDLNHPYLFNNSSVEENCFYCIETKYCINTESFLMIPKHRVIN